MKRLICLCGILLFSIDIVHADTESSDLQNAFGYIDGDHYCNPFLGIEIQWPEAEYKLPPSSSIDEIIANFEDNYDGMVLMMLNDANGDGLSLKLYRSTLEGETEPVIVDRDDDYQAVLLDRLILTLNADEKNLPVLSGGIHTIELSGRKAYWIPISYNYWEGQLHTINIQISIGDYNVLIIANSYQPLSPEDVFSKISFFEQ